MRDAMVALARRGVESAALVHRHTFSLTSRHETYAAGEHRFQVVRTGMWARLMYTPISPAFGWHLWRLVKSCKPDVLHLHLPNPSVFWVLALPAARRVRWVVHWHSDVITSAQDRWMKLFYHLYRPFEKAVLKRADAIVATSLPYLNSSRPLQAWVDKCHVVPLGVGVERFEHSADQQVLQAQDHAAGSGSCHEIQTQPVSNPSLLRVLAIGRLTYYKGFRYLIEAAARVKNLHVDIVGQGEEMHNLRSLRDTFNLQSRLIFHGELSDPDLAKKMAQCDCICLPSIERTEAFGMVLLEAMYFSKATVISDVPGSGMGWIVDDGMTGLKVRSADAEALAETFRTLSGNRENLIRMGQQGRVKFDEQFEINHTVKGLIAVYRQVLTAGGPLHRGPLDI